MLPSFFITLFPWKSGQQYKEFAVKLKHMTGYISLARDRYGGRVYPDAKNPQHIRIDYRLNKYDQAHILEGAASLAELLYVEGAREIHPSNASMVGRRSWNGALNRPILHRSPKVSTIGRRPWSERRQRFLHEQIEVSTVGRRPWGERTNVPSQRERPSLQRSPACFREYSL